MSLGATLLVNNVSQNRLHQEERRGRREKELRSRRLRRDQETRGGKEIGEGRKIKERENDRSEGMKGSKIRKQRR